MILPTIVGKGGFIFPRDQQILLLENNFKLMIAMLNHFSLLQFRMLGQKQQEPLLCLGGVSDNGVETVNTIIPVSSGPKVILPFNPEHCHLSCQDAVT